MKEKLHTYIFIIFINVPKNYKHTLSLHNTPLVGHYLIM